MDRRLQAKHMTLHHLKLSRGSVSLTERMLRSHNTTLALQLHDAMLTGGEAIDLLLTAQQLDELRAILEKLERSTHIGQKALVNNLLRRLPAQSKAG